MRSNTYIIACALAVASALGGCGTSRVAFLHAYRQPGKLGAHQLKKLQFFVSQDIVLRRVEDTSQHEVTAGHAYRAIDGLLREVIELPAGTPGLVAKVDGRTLWVSFEEDGAIPFKYLPKVEGEVGETYRFPFRNGKRLRYRGEYYEVVSGGLGEGLDSHLEMEAEWGQKMEDRRRTMTGRRLAARSSD